MPNTESFLTQIKILLGPKGFTQDPDLINSWLTDWRGRYHGKTLGLASPTNTHEVAAVMCLCAEHLIPVVPQGGNSGMSGGATPDTSGQSLLLSLRRLNFIQPIETQAQQVTCGAGVILQNLHEAAEAEGLRFPLTLGGKGSATLGGLISTNAGGCQVLRHGSMRALVMGLEAVLANGEIYSALTPLKKDNRGFDLKQLFIGSEGTLGIITAATLKLAPAITDRIVIWAGLPSVQHARELLLLCESCLGDAVEGFEILSEHSLEAVCDLRPETQKPLNAPHSWHALIEIVCTKPDETLKDRCENMLEVALRQSILSDATMASNEAQADAFWLIRESISPAERALGPAMQHDISVPTERMPDFIEMIVPEMEKRWPGTQAIAFGHLGDGNVHFHVIAPSGSTRQTWEQQDGKRISQDVHDLVTQWNGSISAEHGIGQMKRDELHRLTHPAQLALMSTIKNAMDPHTLLNPGKLI